tara:strand:- start:264 stop:524 length:261 start_codon:yes stop_codon:yes gene_type:complete
MFLEISLVIVSLLFVTSCYVMWNLTVKIEMLEDWVEQFIQTIDRVNRGLKQADYRGSFESDDEVGFIFKEIKNTIKQLDRFKGEQS